MPIPCYQGAVALVLFATGVAATTVESFPPETDGVHVYQSDDAIGLYNRQVGILFRRNDSSLLCIRTRQGTPSVKGVRAFGKLPWHMEIMPEGSNAAMSVTQRDGADPRWDVTGNTKAMRLSARYRNIQCNNTSCDAVMSVSLRQGTSQLRWRFRADMHDKRASKQLKAAGRTYFFDVEETREGTAYLRVTESRKGKSDTFERNSIHVFPEDATDFAEALTEMIKELE